MQHRKPPTRPGTPSGSPGPSRRLSFSGRENRIVKVVVCGDAAVGKTQLLNRVANDAFQLGSTSTIGVDVHIRNFISPRSKYIYKVSFWDTGGQERFANVIKSHFRDAVAIIFTYDCTSPESFASIEKRWIPDAAWDPTKCLGYLVGTKTDLPNPKVDAGEAFAWAIAHRMHHACQTSSLKGEGIEEWVAMLVGHLDHHWETLRPELEAGGEKPIQLSAAELIPPNSMDKASTEGGPARSGCC